MKGLDKAMGFIAFFVGVILILVLILILILVLNLIPDSRHWRG